MKRTEIKIGTPVIYWGFIGENGELHDPLKTIITSEPWDLGHGETVCNVAGKSGGVAISHLNTISAGSLMAAKLRGLKEISQDDINQATKKFFNDQGVDVVIH